MFSIRTVLFLTLVAGISSQLLLNFRDNFGKSLEQSLKPLENLGDRINQQVQEGLKPLENLGDRINQQVEEGLKPVKLLVARNNLKNGFRGTTIVTLHPSNKKFIIQNGIRYDCTNGEITDALPSSQTCSGDLVKFQPKTKEDYCFRRDGMVFVNNKICIPSSPTGGVSVSVNNNVIECRSADGSPVLMTTQKDFRKTCENVATSITYDYYTIGRFDNPENKLKCNGNGPTRCTLTEIIDETNQNNNGGIINIGDNVNVNYFH